MKKILFIINPISGVGRQKVAEKLIEKKLDKKKFSYQLAYTKSPKHAIEIARNAAVADLDVVVAIGGDGTVNEIGKSLTGTRTAMAILPCGSGNGAARHLKIPVNHSRAMDVINAGKIKTIDTFFLNDEIVINTAGIGYAAHIAHAFSKFKKRGFKNYLKIAVRDSMKYQSQLCRLEYNGIKREVNAFIIDIANGTQWGNNAVIAPHAKSDDGLLDLCIVKEFPFRNFAVMATRLFTRSIHRSKHVEIVQVKEAVIHQQHDYAHIDGEAVFVGKKLHIRINPLSLKVIVP